MRLLKLYSTFLLLFSLLLLCSCNETENPVSSQDSSSVYSKEISEENVESKVETSSSTEVSAGEGKYADEGELKIRIFKMGKSDAYLLRTKSNTILIDCGDVDDSQEILDYFTEKSLKRIDYLIITHLDKKSIGGAAALVSALDIGKIYEPDYTKNSTEYLDLSNSINSKNLSPIKVNSNITLEIDDIVVKISPCEKSYYSDDDNYSSVISITHKDNSFLFVGDAKSDRIKEIVSMDNIQHDFLMMPDNGAYDVETSSLINTVSPSYAAITCSLSNPASSEVLELLSNKNINTYMTVNGSVKITSNGSAITIEQ